MCSATPHLGGKMAKSAIATPALADWHVRTVKMDGSWTEGDGIRWTGPGQRAAV